MPVYTFLLKINGVDAATYGLTVWDLPDHWNAPAQNYDEVAIPGQDGTVETTLEPALAPREFTIRGSLDNATASGFEDQIDALKYALFGSTLTLIGGNRASRQRTGRFASMTSALYALMNAGQVEIKVHCRNPVAYATTTTTVTGTTNTDLACAQGTYRTRPVITITSPSFPLVVTYKNYGGTPLTTLTIASGSGTVVIDCALRTVTVNGTRNDAAMTAGDFFALNPQDGDYTLSHWPTVRVSSGTPSIAYTQAFL